MAPGSMNNGCNIRVSKAIVDRCNENRCLKSADKGLIHCVNLNNKEMVLAVAAAIQKD